MLKTHSCGSLRPEHAGQTVTLAGWVNRRRDHGGLVFIDLRDRSGVVQTVFNPEVSPKALAIAEEMRTEYVIRLTGTVSKRPSGTENEQLATGGIEIVINEAEILNTSLTPPFYINEEVEVDESLRLRYRYLDLRRQRMKNNLMTRHKIVKFMREFLDAKDFVEVETPIFVKSTPEGARDYLVPSRVHPGCFYALPQSPQQLKQLLMVGGLEKYYQMARCFRDEDLRADRQPEHTQLDVEMSFVTQEDILSLLEELFTNLTRQIRPDVGLVTPFPRLTYAEAMENFASDKPDLRYTLKTADVTDIAGQTEFGVFKTIVAAGGKVKGITMSGCGNYSRGQLEELNKLAVSAGAKGLLTISLGSEPGSIEELRIEDIKSVAAKYMSIEQVKEIGRRCEAKQGDLVLIIAGKAESVYAPLDALRREIANRLGLIDKNKFVFAFIVDFPLIARSENGGWEAVNNPFTHPRDEDLLLLDTAPDKVIGKNYDLTCNGVELLSGSIRIHNPMLQRKILAILGYKEEEVERLFGHMLEAFSYGAPPHGGFGAGIDRITMCLTGEETIREVTAFPKTQNAQDLTLGCPSPVAEQQLKDLHIRLRDDA